MASITLPTATLIAGGVGAAGAIGGAAISGSAANSAANKTANAADNATAVQKQEFDATTANNKPFLTTGTSAMDRLGSLYGLDTIDPTTGATTPGSAQPAIDPNATFYQTPDYQFTLSQGIKGVDAGAAATGMLDSGATRKAEIAYAGNLASGQFNNYAQRLQSLAGIGQTAATNQATAGANYANNYSNTITNAANATNSVNTSAANSASAALQQITGQIQSTLGKNPFGSSYASSGGTATPTNGVTPAGWQGNNGNGVLY